MEDVMITGSLCAAARTLVELSQSRLADKVGISRRVVRDFESGVTQPDSVTIALLQTKLEEFGALFIPDDRTMGEGVRLKFSRSITNRLADFENEGGAVGNDNVS
jgi:transcriptional regulator with XRE-family HTH domain